MFVDLRMAKTETEYRTQKLSRSYPEVTRDVKHDGTPRGRTSQWTTRFARLLAISR